LEFVRYKKKNRHENSSVSQTNVSHFKTKVLHVRIDSELEKNLNEFAAELGEDKSKSARDILTDFFLERNHKAWLEEVMAGRSKGLVTFYYNS